MIEAVVSTLTPSFIATGVPWNLSTDVYPAEDRVSVWDCMMGRLSLPVPRIGGLAGGFHGDATGLVSPHGIEFSMLASTPQTIAGCCPIKADSMWLVLVMEGRAQLESKNIAASLTAGDIVFGPTGRHASLVMETDFRLLYAKIPANALHPRLLSPSCLPIGHLSRNLGICHVLGGMLHSLADSIDQLTPERMLAIDLVISEFLVAGAAMVKPEASAAKPRKIVEFQRLCDALERQLSDPDLSLRKFAAGINASSRYVQKLFETVGLSFSQYLRQRRLDRCRLALREDACAGLSISDICFRWGFNDAAHFSRSFREEFGMSPREYRRGPITE